MLATARVARFATASADGEPLVVPICFVLIGDRLYWAVDAKPKRTRRLRRVRHIGDNPHVSLVVDLWDEDWTRLQWVLVEGTAAIQDQGPERTRALAALVAKYPQYAGMRLPEVAGEVIAITPTRITAWRARQERGGHE